MDIQLNFMERESGYFVMDFEEFRSGVIRDLLNVCGPEFSVESRDVRKNNGVTLHGISIAGPGETVIPTVYLETLYEQYEKGNINVMEAANEVLKAYSREKTEVISDKLCLTNFEKVKEKLIFRLINAEKNSELLQEIPHRRFLDLAVTYTVFLEDIFECSGNVTVRNDIMEKWGVDEAELFSLAMENTPRIKKPVIKELSDVIGELISGDDDPMIRQELKENAGIRMFVLTSNDGYYGDSLILYPGLLKEFRKIMGVDLYLLPSSVHEFIVVPDTGEIRGEELSELVKSVNETSVGAEDYLSDSVYLFKDDEIEICA